MQRIGRLAGSSVVRHRAGRAVMLAAASVFAGSSIVQAAPSYWTNTTAGSYSLSTGSNWEGGATLTSSADDLRFFINSSSTDLTLGGAFTINNDVSGLALNRLQLDGQSTSSGRSVSITGNSIAFNNGATLSIGNNASSGGNAFGYTVDTVTLSGGLVIEGSPSNTPTTAVTFSNTTLAGTASTFTHNSNARIAFNNVSLGANHSFAGTGSGGITFGGAVALTGNRTFDVTGSATPVLGGTISDGASSYSITKTGSGVLGIGAGTHNIDGGIIVQGGVLQLLVGSGSSNATSAGITVQNGSTVRLEWAGTPTAPVSAQSIDYGAGGGALEFGTSSGNSVPVSLSGNVTGSGALRIVTRTNKDILVLSGDNSAYSGPVRVEYSGSPYALSQTSAVRFASADAHFGADSNAKIQFGAATRVGFDGAVTAASLDPYVLDNFSGINLHGTSGVMASSVTDPFALVPAGGALMLFNRDALNQDRIDNSAGLDMSSQALQIVGRNSNGASMNETVGAITYAGSSRITLERLNSTGGVTLTAASLTAAGAGNSLQLDNNNTSDYWGTDASANVRLVVTGAKPTVSNGMVSPGIQFINGGNATGHFMTFSGNFLVRADTNYVSAFNSGSSTEIANVSGGTLTADETVHALRLGGNLTVNSGVTLNIASGGLIMGSQTVSGAGTINFGNSPAFLGAYNGAAQGSFSAKISGTGGLTILGTAQALNVSSEANDFTGGIFINGGNVSFATSSANGNDVTVNAFGRLMTPGTSTASVIGGLSGIGRVAGFFQGNNTTSGTIAITPAVSTTHTFGGHLLNGDSGRLLNITKNGAGTQIFDTTVLATHTGTTKVAAGKLVVNGDLSGATGAVTVDSGAILAGSGRIGGATTVTGVVAPGNSIGTLSVLNNVTWNGAAAGSADTDWQFELGAGNTADLLQITGNFSKGSGSVFRFDFEGSTATGVFKLVDWSGTSSFVASDFSYVNLGGGNTGTFSINGSQLELTVVPEPATLTLLGLGAAGLLSRRRRM